MFRIVFGIKLFTSPRDLQDQLRLFLHICKQYVISHNRNNLQIPNIFLVSLLEVRQNVLTVEISALKDLTLAYFCYTGSHFLLVSGLRGGVHIQKLYSDRECYVKYW